MDRVRNRTLINFGWASLVAVAVACANEPVKPADTPAPAAVPPAVSTPAPPAAPPAGPPVAAPITVPDEPPDQKFKVADLDADGWLDESEMRAEARKMRGAGAPADGEEAFFQEAKRILMPADTNKDGKISRQEYFAWSKSEAPK
jgi:hypothetical protein